MYALRVLIAIMWSPCSVWKPALRTYATCQLCIHVHVHVHMHVLWLLYAVEI